DASRPRTLCPVCTHARTSIRSLLRRSWHCQGVPVWASADSNAYSSTTVIRGT
ncbi:hypothetical protein FJTKL_15469, partial [Diaporthe vaccinii]